MKKKDMGEECGMCGHPHKKNEKHKGRKSEKGVMVEVEIGSTKKKKPGYEKKR